MSINFNWEINWPRHILIVSQFDNEMTFNIRLINIYQKHCLKYEVFSTILNYFMNKKINQSGLFKLYFLESQKKLRIFVFVQDETFYIYFCTPL